MASVQNSFDLLEAASKAGGQQGSQGGGKKKNKNKANAPATGPEQHRQQQPVENGVHPALGSSAGAPRKAPAANESSLLAALESWERAARECKSLDSRSVLWRDWIANVRVHKGKNLIACAICRMMVHVPDIESPSCMQAGEKSKAKYKGASGALMDFRTALLESRALELSIEGSVLAAGGIDIPLLALLMSTFLSFDEGNIDGPTSLATTLVRASLCGREDFAARLRVDLARVHIRHNS
eukprot:1154408-Pelagomonas_calceolata.AAC.4